ncbi:mitochondrial 37S ribosomal protein MRP2 [Dipodascopsis uninucleata]
MAKGLPKIPIPNCHLNTHIIRDNMKRHVAAEAEPERMALKYMAYNTTLPMKVRMQAQLKLANMHSWTRMGEFRNRCVVSGKGRSILSDFKMSRYRLKLAVRDGLLPGVKRASW